LIETCIRRGTRPTYIIPRPIVQKDEVQKFQREINIPLNSELLKNIEKIGVPESVQINISQRLPEKRQKKV